MPEQPKPDLTAYIGMLKHEISEHCMKLMERMDSCYEIEKSEMTAHVDKEITEHANKENILIQTRTKECLKFLQEWESIIKDDIRKYADKEIERIITSIRSNFVDLEKELTEVDRIRDYLKEPKE